MTVLGQCQKCGGNPSDRDYGQEYWVECEACGFSPGKFQNRFCADVEWNSPIAPTQGADGESLRPVAWQYKVAGRIELHSHQLDHFYFINGSYVKGTPLYATRDAAPSKAISDVLAERERQDAQWGGQDHDDQHTKADWQNYIYRQHYAASSFCGSPEQYRVRLVKIAALAVAAIESIDRVAASAPREKTS